MRAIFTGASGFLGQSFIRGWSQPAIAVSRRRLVLIGNWTWFPRNEMLSKGMDGVDALVHLEVKHHVQRPTAGDLAEFERVNVGGTREWLDWCERNAIFRFIYFSSMKAVVPNRNGVTDEAGTEPNRSAYGASKWSAEQLVRIWAAGDIRRSAIILRPAVVYGRGNFGNVAAMVEAIRRGRFFLVGENENRKSLVSVGNLVAAAEFVAQNARPGMCEIFNVTDTRTFTVRELDAAIRTTLGKRGNSPSLPLPAARAIARFGDAFCAITGKKFPITSDRLEALLETTDFSCEKLIRYGFRHPKLPLADLVCEQ